MREATRDELKGAVRTAVEVCLEERDERSFEEIKRMVDRLLASEGASAARQPIQVQVSRLLTSKEPRTHITAHTKPPRFVSIARTRTLIHRVRMETASPRERKALAEIAADLRAAADHYRDEHRKARTRANEVTDLATPALKALGIEPEQGDIFEET
jgi:hypothetical protein